MNKYKLADIVDVISEREDNPSNCIYDRFVGLEHFVSGGIEIKKYGDTNSLKSAMKIFKAGDILIARRNVYLKRASIVNFDGITSGDSIILRVKDDLMKKLLPFVFNTDNFWEYAEKFSDGTMSKRLSPKILLEYEFNLPDIEEQEKIAKLLWAANETKEAYKKLLSLTEELVKTQFIELFTEKEYEERPISYFVNTNIEKVRKRFMSTDTIKYVDISSIDNVSKKVSGYKEYQLNEAPSRAQQLLKSEDIIISTVRPNLRNFAINTFEDENLVGTSGFCVLRAEKCPVEYIWGIIMTDKFTADMVSLTTGTNYPAIKDKDILNYQIPDAPEAEMQKYADFVKQSDKSKFDLQETITSIENTVKSLLKQYIG